MFRSSLGQNPLQLVALNRDVFFGIKLRNLAKELGYDLKLVPTAAALDNSLAADHANVALIVVDMNVLKEEIDWDTISALIQAYPDLPSLGFGSHTDIDSRRAAKLAGLTRIVSNGDFHRNAADLIQRYARPDPADD
jgi:hypothetical protein